MIDGRINFLVTQNEARCWASPFQSLEEFLWQFIILASKSLAGIERPEEIQTAAADFHQFIHGQVPTCNGVDHRSSIFRIVKSPCGAVNELTKFSGIQHRIKDFGLIRKADFFISEAIGRLRRTKPNLLEAIKVEITDAFFV